MILITEIEDVARTIHPTGAIWVPYSVVVSSINTLNFSFTCMFTFLITG